MERSPSKAIRIKQETLEIIKESLPYLERDNDLGGAVNYVLKKGIEALGLPKKKQEPILFVEQRNQPRHKKAN